MSKTRILFSLFCLLALVISGCGGGGGSTTTPTATPTVTLGGSVAPAPGIAAAPGRNLALSAAGLTARAMNGATVLATSSVSAAGVYSLVFTPTVNVAVEIQVINNATGKIVFRRFLGEIQKPTASATVSNITVNETTTAKALIVATIQAKGVKTASESLVLATKLDPAAITNFGTDTDPVDQAITSIGGNQIALLANMVKAVTAVLSANAGNTTILTVDLSSVSNLATVATAALQKAKTDALDISATVATVTIGATTVNTATIATQTIPSAGDVAAADAGVIAQTAAVTIPTITTMKVDGKDIYTAAGGATTVAADSGKPTFQILFSETMTAVNPVIVARVTETNNGIETTQYVQHGGTVPTGYKTWAQVFTATPDILATTPATTFTFAVSQTSTLSIAAGATVKVQLLKFSGIQSQATQLGLAQPGSLTGFFTTPAQ